MKKKLLTNFAYTILFAIYTVSPAIGANIVYPKSDCVTINSPETFFIGNENFGTSLKINDELVDIHESGGFWHTVKLDYGENIFNIDNGQSVKTFKIFRELPTTVNTDNKNNFNTYKQPVYIQISKDATPLRSTPIDAGMNRLQHFAKGMKFQAIGEINNFYKVKLARDDYGYIAKTSTNTINIKNLSPSKIQTFAYSEDTHHRVFKLKLDKPAPYILSENNGLDLVVYNIDGYLYNKYEFHINQTGKMYGYKNYYTEENELTIEVYNEPHTTSAHPLKNITITIDPGHGGNEFGAIGCLGDNEKDINLSIAKILENKLKEAGAIVNMTRNDDTDVSLQDRVKIANEHGTQIFLSIHNNALPDSLAHLKSSGTEIYYYYPQSKDLAHSLSDSITKYTGTKNNGVKQQSFAVIRNTQCLSVLIELAYIINPEDNAKLIDRDFQEKAADAIVKGLEIYLK